MQHFHAQRSCLTAVVWRSRNKNQITSYNIKLTWRRVAWWLWFWTHNRKTVNSFHGLGGLLRIPAKHFVSRCSSPNSRQKRVILWWTGVPFRLGVYRPWKPRNRPQLDGMACKGSFTPNFYYILLSLVKNKRLKTSDLFIDLENEKLP